ncbi:hypothetical protein Q2T41_19755 [Maribacter confluentis]|uniref:Uncharacterized protein n=1 Tax=Maribacter confluentis TaxID=1656093 RepID=A0ABT8RXG2_9FLAO|nr:hypothetical protein [Maribacter confluentis]MDO1513412.1 hypothetical protein [Maribacter confluentis]MDO1514862.1 hypothetical protein [Maribacter confluentis]
MHCSQPGTFWNDQISFGAMVIFYVNRYSRSSRRFGKSARLTIIEPLER